VSNNTSTPGNRIHLTVFGRINMIIFSIILLLRYICRYLYLYGLFIKYVNLVGTTQVCAGTGWQQTARNIFNAIVLPPRRWHHKLPRPFATDFYFICSGCNIFVRVPGVWQQSLSRVLSNRYIIIIIIWLL